MTTAHKSRVLDMTRGDPFRLVLQFSLPLFCSNLLQQVYNLTDTALAGHLLGSAALAEIGATAALYGLIMNFAFGMNNGLALTVSRCFGAGEREGIRRAVGWMVTLSAAVSLVLTTVSLLGRGALLQALQVPAEVWDGAAAYLTVILLGIPLTMLYNMEAALLRAVGNSVTPLLFLLFSSVLNVGLDAAFMGPLGMGVRGAAVATVLAQGISAVLGAVYLVRSYPELHFAPAHLKKSARRAVMNMFWAGMSMGLMSAIYNLGSVALQSSINALGSVYITAQTAARRMAEMYFIPGGALGISVATFSSQNLGAGRRSRIGQSVRAALKIYFVWWLFVLAFTFLLGEPVLRLITGSSDARIISNAMPVSQNQRTDHPAYGRTGDPAQYAAGHPPHGRAAAGQRAGADRQGDLCSLAGAGLGLPRCLLLRANDMDHLLCVHPAGSLALPQRPAGRLPAR